MLLKEKSVTIILSEGAHPLHASFEKNKFICFFERCSLNIRNNCFPPKKAENQVGEYVWKKDYLPTCWHD